MTLIGQRIHMDTLRHHYSDDINSGQCQSKLTTEKKIFAAIFRLVANKGPTSKHDFDSNIEAIKVQ